jgi:hypothetical protein
VVTELHRGRKDRVRKGPSEKYPDVTFTPISFCSHYTRCVATLIAQRTASSGDGESHADDRELEISA